MLTVGSLFSGIGGFELGLEATGEFKTIWQCEINEYCLKVLAKHWPDVKRFTDIKKMGIEEDIPYADVICGGFPCQPVSCAGKRKGREDERWLWPEFYRIICSVKPRWVLVENVPGLFSAKDSQGNKGALFGGILRDLAAAGYNAKWQIISAASVGAPHLRKRAFIMANAGSRGCPPRRPRCITKTNSKTDSGKASIEFTGNCYDIPNTAGVGCGGREMLLKTTEPGRGLFTEGNNPWLIEPDVGRVAHGIPARMDRLRALGNAIVPQCAEVIGRQLLDMEVSL